MQTLICRIAEMDFVEWVKGEVRWIDSDSGSRLACEAPIRTSRSRSVRSPRGVPAAIAPSLPLRPPPSFICPLYKKLFTCVTYEYSALASYAGLPASDLRFIRDASRRLQG